METNVNLELTLATAIHRIQVESEILAGIHCLFISSGLRDLLAQITVRKSYTWNKASRVDNIVDIIAIAQAYQDMNDTTTAIMDHP